MGPNNVDYFKNDFSRTDEAKNVQEPTEIQIFFQRPTKLPTWIKKNIFLKDKLF